MAIKERVPPKRALSPHMSHRRPKSISLIVRWTFFSLDNHNHLPTFYKPTITKSIFEQHLSFME
jgi:hypothetical protein